MPCVGVYMLSRFQGVHAVLRRISAHAYTSTIQHHWGWRWDSCAHEPYSPLRKLGGKNRTCHASLDSDIRQTFAFTKHDTFHSRNIDIPYDYIDNTVKARVYKWESMRAFMTAPARLAEDRTMFAHSLALFFHLGPSRRRVLEDDNWEYEDMG